MAKKILYFQHRKTLQCQNIEEGTKIANMLKKAPKTWGVIKGKDADESLKLYKKALSGERQVESKYAKPVGK